MLFKPTSLQDWEQWLIPVQKQLFDELCQWIDVHLGEPIGWQQLMTQSGLQYQTIQSLFYKHHSLSPMTWIRRRREVTQYGKSQQRPTVRTYVAK
jgi:AraC-like DNA-binding protein